MEHCPQTSQNLRMFPLWIRVSSQTRCQSQGGAPRTPKAWPSASPRSSRTSTTKETPSDYSDHIKGTFALVAFDSDD